MPAESWLCSLVLLQPSYSSYCFAAEGVQRSCFPSCDGSEAGTTSVCDGHHCSWSSLCPVRGWLSLCRILSRCICSGSDHSGWQCRPVLSQGACQPTRTRLCNPGSIWICAWLYSQSGLEASGVKQIGSDYLPKPIECRHLGS